MPELLRSFDETRSSDLEALVLQRAWKTLAQDENARRETGHFIFTNSGRGCEMIFSSFNRSLCL
jgi:hypothetical protein